MSHEQSETVQLPSGGWANVYGRRTPQAGQRLDNLEYQSVDEAVNAARSRSQSFDKKKALIKGLRKPMPPIPLPGGVRG